VIYWTIQHKNVVETIEKRGSYFPDFSLSPQTHKATYDRLLGIYNRINQTSYVGLIFCIEKDASRAATSLAFNDEKDFVEYLNERNGVIAALNNGAYTLFDKNHFLCKIETDEFDDSYPCRVDFWNLVFMMPDVDGGDEPRYDSCRYINPAFQDLSYGDFIDQSWLAMEQQKTLRPLMNSTVFQVNIPYIKREMLKSVFPISELFLLT